YFGLRPFWQSFRTKCQKILRLFFLRNPSVHEGTKGRGARRRRLSVKIYSCIFWLANSTRRLRYLSLSLLYLTFSSLKRGFRSFGRRFSSSKASLRLFIERSCPSISKKYRCLLLYLSKSSKMELRFFNSFQCLQ